MSSALCSECQQIDWNDVLVEKRNHVLMHSIPSLRNSATGDTTFEGGCPLCGLIYSSLLCSIDDDPDVPSFTPKEEGKETEIITITALCQECIDRTHVGMLLVGTDLDSKLGVLIPCKMDELTGKATEFHHAKMTLSRDPHTPKLSWKEDLRDIRNKRTGSLPLQKGWTYPAELICCWIEHCLTQHEACYFPSEDPPFPTRVIDVGTLQDPITKLFETEGARGRWIALSYRWGHETPFKPRLKTTIATSPDFQDNIPWDLLPRVLQDAIFVTRGLGIRYIWIDSFCIVQDWRADWEREAARMAGVYRDSYLTIAASGANTPHQSLFLDRFNIRSKPVRIEVRSDSEGATRVQYIHRTRYSIRQSLNSDPLQQRGWTFQETQLAVRVLYFSEKELFWQCREGVSRELSPTQYIIPADPLVPRRMFDSYVKWPVSVFGRWCDLVERFTARDLTYKSDTLPAMSGLAAELALFLRSRSKRRLATAEEARKLLQPLPPPPGFPEVQGPIGPSIYAGINGQPVNDMANGAAAAILDQVEFFRGSPLPGYEDRPLRMDYFLSAHTRGTPIGPYGDGCSCSHTITEEGWEVMKRIGEKSGFYKAMQAMDCDDLTDDLFFQIMTEPATHAAFQGCFHMCQQYLHEGIDPTVSVTEGDISETPDTHREPSCTRDHENGLPITDYGTAEAFPAETQAEEQNLNGDTRTAPRPPGLTIHTLGDVVRRMVGSSMAAEFLRTNPKESFPHLEGFSEQEVFDGLSSMMSEHMELPQPDASGRMEITLDTKEMFEKRKSAGNNDSKLPAPPEIAQVAELYVYKDTPFPACVEWPEIVEDDCYLAGLWRVDLWVGLSWFRVPSSPAGIRPAYRAPTWSWASLDCSGVTFPGGPSNYTRTEDGLAHANDLELLDSRVMLAGLNPFGQVLSGRLVLLGRIVELPFFDDEHGQSQPRVDGVELGDNLKMMVRDDSDVLPVHCKSIAIDHRTNLVVEPVTMLNGIQAYRRVGLWMQDVRDNTLLEDDRDSPKEIIILV